MTKDIIQDATKRKDNSTTYLSPEAKISLTKIDRDLKEGRSTYKSSNVNKLIRNLRGK